MVDDGGRDVRRWPAGRARVAAYRRCVGAACTGPPGSAEDQRWIELPHDYSTPRFVLWNARSERDTHRIPLMDLLKASPPERDPQHRHRGDGVAGGQAKLFSEPGRLGGSSSHPPNDAHAVPFAPGVG